MLRSFVRSLSSRHPSAQNSAPGKVLQIGQVPWENIVDLHGLPEDAGFCRRIADSEVLSDPDCAVVAGVYRLEPGLVHPLHIHPGVAELYYVLSGSGLFTVGDEEFEAGPGTSMYIPQGLPHAARATESAVEFFYTFPTGRIDQLGTTFV